MLELIKVANFGKCLASENVLEHSNASTQMSDYCIISSKNECRTISNEKQCHVANDVDPEDVNDRKCCVRFASPCIVTLKDLFFFIGLRAVTIRHRPRGKPIEV